MPTVSELLAAAIQQHKSGQLQVAEQLYRQILAADPTCVDAWNLLGVMATHLGQYEQATQCLTAALSLKPESADLHYNLGSALHRLGKLSDAAAAYQRASELNPKDGRPLNNLGTVLQQQGNFSQAIAYHRQACNLNPNDANARFNLANDFQSQNKWDEAIACYQEVLRLKPDWTEAYSNLGNALQGRGDVDDAIAAYRQALKLRPDSAEVLANLGGALKRRGDLDEAAMHLRRVVDLAPNLAAANLNLGMVLHKQCRLDEALPPLRKGIQLSPNSADAHNVLGLVLRDQGHHEEAMTCFRHALSLSPDLADARTNQAIMLLAEGEFQTGWTEYEWRWKCSESPAPPFDTPRWNGDSLHGRTILLYAEQGLGDTLQFVRYVPLVKQRGATVIVQCQKALLPLLSRCPGIDRLVSRGEQLPHYDVQAPLLSLPALFQTNVENIPASLPYLFADPQLVRYWRDRLASSAGLRIGINWRGRAGQGMFRQRDIPLECFASLNGLPITLINLQQDASETELSTALPELSIFHPGHDVDRAHGAFMDTAAIMMNLDLVISSDTSLPHLAAALGIPVWIALPFVASWQWMRDRHDSPWYPTARLFRQKTPGDWDQAFAEIHTALKQHIDHSA
jgi:tetratricopeptide (TPR) repeat protein